LRDIDQILLLTLLEHGKITFRKLRDVSKISPRIMRRHLDSFLEKGLIHEEKRSDWKRGQKIHYNLTRKGREACIRFVFNNVNESLKIVQRISTKILSDPARLKEWRKMSRETLFKIKITDGMPLDERIKTVMAEMKKIYGPLWEGYKAMHKLICQLTLPQEFGDFFIGFSEKDKLCMIPAELLRKKGLLETVAEQIRREYRGL